MKVKAMENTKQIVDKLMTERILSEEEFSILLKSDDKEMVDYLQEKAREVSIKYFGNKIYTRGLVEFTNYCKNDCYYCGIRKSNENLERYRLSHEEIMSSCANGYELGFRTFVLQGGEDGYYSDERVVHIIEEIRKTYHDCAITLSMGEKSYESYLKYFEAGADRYLLRHETASEDHYRKLHPESLSLKHRKECLFDLKKIGYQVGCGFMVGSPCQTTENLVEDLLFIKELSPEMIGIGPFLPHHDTPFAKEPQGSYEMTLRLISIVRLMIPNALIPATTALGTINPLGRENGILAGANVVMPNLSPVSVRKKYELYDNKICTGDEAAECKFCLQNRLKKIGYEIEWVRGDFVPFINESREKEYV